MQKVKQFGYPPLFRDYEWSPTPAGAPCGLHYAEHGADVIQLGDHGLVFSDGTVVHRQCFLLNVLGANWRQEVGDPPPKEQQADAR